MVGACLAQPARCGSATHRVEMPDPVTYRLARGTFRLLSRIQAREAGMEVRDLLFRSLNAGCRGGFAARGTAFGLRPARGQLKS